MVTNEFTHLSKESLCKLIRQMKRSEEDLRERIATRAQQVGELGDKKHATLPDPVRKRLAFLLVKWEKQRRAAESELATRETSDWSATDSSLERIANMPGFEMEAQGSSRRLQADAKCTKDPLRHLREAIVP